MGRRRRHARTGRPRRGASIAGKGRQRRAATTAATIWASCSRSCRRWPRASSNGAVRGAERGEHGGQGDQHWAVLEIGGGVVERRAYALSGGSGTELGTLIERPRVGTQDKIAGLLLRVEPLDISLPGTPPSCAPRCTSCAPRGRRSPATPRTRRARRTLVLAACDRIGLAPLGRPQLAIGGPTAMPITCGRCSRSSACAPTSSTWARTRARPSRSRATRRSKEMEETLGAILDRHYQTMVDAIAADRDSSRPRCAS